MTLIKRQETHRKIKKKRKLMRASGSIFHARNLNTPGCIQERIERQKSCDNLGKRYVKCHAVMLITG